MQPILRFFWHICTGRSLPTFCAAPFGLIGATDGRTARRPLSGLSRPLPHHPWMIMSDIMDNGTITNTSLHVFVELHKQTEKGERRTTYSYIAESIQHVTQLARRSKIGKLRKIQTCLIDSVFLILLNNLTERSFLQLRNCCWTIGL